MEFFGVCYFYNIDCCYCFSYLCGGRLNLKDFDGNGKPQKPIPYNFKEGDRVIVRGVGGVVVEVLRFSCRVRLDRADFYGHVCPLVSFSDLEVIK